MKNIKLNSNEPIRVHCIVIGKLLDIPFNVSILAQNKIIGLLGGRAVTASCLSFIFMPVSIRLEVGQLDKQPKQKMPHASFLPPVKKQRKA